MNMIVDWTFFFERTLSKTYKSFIIFKDLGLVVVHQLFFIMFLYQNIKFSSGDFSKVYTVYLQPIQLPTTRGILKGKLRKD